MYDPTDPSPMDALAARLDAAIAEVKRLRADVRVVELMMEPPGPVPARPPLAVIPGSTKRRTQRRGQLHIVRGVS